MDTPHAQERNTPLHVEETREAPTDRSEGISRRGFLHRAGGAAAAVAVAGVAGGLPLSRPASAARLGSRAKQATAVGGSARARQAYAVRVAAAEFQSRQAAAITPNSDEMAYPSRFASNSKLLPHNAIGEVDPAAYNALLKAARSARPEDWAAVPMGGTQKFANPQASYAYLLQGTDPAAYPVPPAPSFNSAEEAAEMAEMYWMALARDVPFPAYPTDPLVAKAAQDLSRLSDFRGPKAGGSVTPATVFTMGLAGETTGPFVSQFLTLPIPYGVQTIPQLYPVAPNKDFMTTLDEWLVVQNGQYVPPKPPSTPATPPAKRYMFTGRDFHTFLHGDFLQQAYLNAALILQKLGFVDKGNPYVLSKNQVGVGTFGPHHLHEMVAKVANAAVDVSFYYKWIVHRRIRAEEFGGRVHVHKTGGASYPIHADLLTTSTVLDAIHAKYGSYLLPIGSPEGCPNHPSYPGGHPAVTGACVTLLKAWFDESAVLPNPVMVSPSGNTLVPYTGPDLTVGGELNKGIPTNKAFGMC
jgi:hypothetical protein